MASLGSPRVDGALRHRDGVAVAGVLLAGQERGGERRGQEAREQLSLLVTIGCAPFLVAGEDLVELGARPQVDDRALELLGRAEPAGVPGGGLAEEAAAELALEVKKWD